MYHNVEHTMLVTLAGYDIMRGRALLMPTDASDFAHLIFACLFHDIGYVRGILEGGGPDGYVIDAKGGKTKLPHQQAPALIEQAKGLLEVALAQEQEDFDDLPEDLQDEETGQRAEDTIDALERAVTCCDETMSACKVAI